MKGMGSVNPPRNPPWLDRAINYVIKRERVFMFIPMSYAALLIAASVVEPFVYAQNHYNINNELNSIVDLKDRMERIEKLDLDKRLTILETVRAETNRQNIWSTMGTGGVGLLILERVLVRGKKKRTEGEES